MCRKINCFLLVIMFGSLINGQSVEYNGLVVGINDYEPIANNLKWAVADAEAMKQSLIDNEHWLSSDIHSLLNNSATLDNITNSICQYLPTATNKTNLFHFSGHGGMGAILTYDPNQQLLIYLGPHRLESYMGYQGFNQYTAIIDACDSGPFADEMSSGVILTACDSGEESSEPDELGHGTFSYFVLQGLSNNAAAGSNGFLSAEGLYAYARPLTTAYDTAMHPQIGDHYSGGDLVLNYNLCLFVPQQYSTIQSALSAANSGQIIVISSGTYNENLTIGNKNNIFITGQGAASTIINGSLTAYFCNNLNINALRLNSLTAIYCNLGNFHNNIYGGGMGFSSCTGFDQFGYISNCTTGLTTSFSTGHVYPTSNFSSNSTSIYSTGSGNILVDCSRLCTSTNYDFAASSGSYISSYLSYFRNGQPRIHYLGGTVSVNYPMSCGMAKESNTADIQDDHLLTPIQIDDPVETEFSKINISYFNLLKEIKKFKEKGASDNIELKDQLLNNANDFKNFIKKHPQSSLSHAALTTAASSFPLYEDNTGMKNFLDEIINDKELTSLKGTAENLMIDCYINIKDFEGAVSIADDCINNYKSDDDLVCEGLLKKGIILAHKMNQPEKGTECFTAVVNNYPDNPIAEFAKNELKVLRKDGGAIDKENLTAENLEFNTSSYPNPFNPTTIIKYSLPTDEKVVIKVYDILGREIAILANEFKTSGTYSVQFDGSNLSSGVYFYIIEAGKFSQTKKLVLTK